MSLGPVMRERPNSCQHRNPETGEKECPNEAVPGGSFCYDHGGRP